MFTINSKVLTAACLLVLAGSTSEAQLVKREQPVWWFGASAAVNHNNYQGTTQMLNKNLTVPTAFHKGSGFKPYFSLLTEYRPNKIWGGMLNLAYDNRGSQFNGVMAPCNCPANLSTNLSYVNVEPALRVAPFASSFYLFAGPVLGFNVANSFTYTQEKQADKKADWSDVRNTALSAQAGAGFDLYLSPPSSRRQMSLSPFASFQSNVGRDPRAVESWSIYTFRVGMAVKFGAAKKPLPVAIVEAAPVVPEATVGFTVRAPKLVPISRQVKETFALRNSVFFESGSTQIPTRYIKLNKGDAGAFKEEQLQQAQPNNLYNGRSARQMAVYHNILNIMGDRLRANPASAIVLTGSSENNPAEGLMLAESVKDYLVNIFGINGSRITVEGREKPLIPSEQPGGTKELVLLREGDRRVDINSTSPELLLQVGGSTSPFLKPVQIIAVQEDPLDSHVIFTATGADTLLSSWKIQVIDEKGKVQEYGPFYKNQASVSGNAILGDDPTGNYKVIMLGTTKSGNPVRKESSVGLIKSATPSQEGLRYSILFDFNKSKSIDSYEKFLSDVISPLIPENATVIIHGHTDIIGDEKYNHNLSHERAMSAQKILEVATKNSGKAGIKFETSGYGEDVSIAPFENTLPEERFYNRTVIIDIIVNK
jgi:outer membrane protein OmpA-like peptidoglycan-associated protein